MKYLLLIIYIIQFILACIMFPWIFIIFGLIICGIIVLYEFNKKENKDEQ